MFLPSLTFLILHTAAGAESPFANGILNDADNGSCKNATLVYRKWILGER
jgi:hypothetical protein